MTASPAATAWSSRTADERLDLLLNQRHPPLQVEPQIERDLFVSRPPGVQAASGVADTLDQLPLDERVHVLVVLGRRRIEERRIGSGDENLVERRLDGCGLLL